MIIDEIKKFARLATNRLEKFQFFRAEPCGVIGRTFFVILNASVKECAELRGPSVGIGHKVKW